MHTRAHARTNTHTQHTHTDTYIHTYTLLLQQWHRLWRRLGPSLAGGAAVMDVVADGATADGRRQLSSGIAGLEGIAIRWTAYT